MTPRSRIRATLGLLDNLRTTPVLSEATQRLIREADTGALQRAGVARIITGGLLLLAVVVATASIDFTNPMAVKQIWAAELTLALFGMVGWVGAWLASRRIAIQSLPIITALLDALLVLGNLGYSHWGLGVPGGFYSVFPVAWVVPITMAAAAIHYQPRLQVYRGGGLCCGPVAARLRRRHAEPGGAPAGPLRAWAACSRRRPTWSASSWFSPQA